MSTQYPLYDLILDRRSCKEYLPQPLPQETLSSIVEAGRHAPSGMDRQLNHFFVVTQGDVLDAITRLVSLTQAGYEGRDCRYGAPALVIVANQKDNGSALQDASCAMENMMLAACALGVGSRWINQPYRLSEHPTLRALLAPYGLEPQEQICASLALGLPAGELFPGRKDHPGNRVSWV